MEVNVGAKLEIKSKDKKIKKRRGKENILDDSDGMESVGSLKEQGKIIKNVLGFKNVAKPNKFNRKGNGLENRPAAYIGAARNNFDVGLHNSLPNYSSPAPVTQFTIIGVCSSEDQLEAQTSNDAVGSCMLILAAAVEEGMLQEAKHAAFYLGMAFDSFLTSDINRCYCLQIDDGIGPFTAFDSNFQECFSSSRVESKRVGFFHCLS